MSTPKRVYYIKLYLLFLHTCAYLGLFVVSMGEEQLNTVLTKYIKYSGVYCTDLAAKWKQEKFD